VLIKEMELRIWALEKTVKSLQERLDGPSRQRTEADCNVGNQPLPTMADIERQFGRKRGEE
jgi:hypothetical protein